MPEPRETARQPAIAACVLIVACLCVPVAGASSVSFPPPGRIAFSARTPSSGPLAYSLFTAAADGTGARQITTNTGAPDVDARWSPDGTQVVFTRVVAPDNVASSVWVVNADGTDAHRVSGGPSYAEHPKWSPDGQWVAFQEQTGFGSRGARDSTRYELWLVRPDGSGLRSLDADADTCDSSDLVGDGNAWDWSPDSRHIAFTHMHQGGSCDPSPPTINVLDPITGARRRLTTGSYPAWSPDGTRVAFVDRCRIWLIPATGGKRAPITPRIQQDDYDCLANLEWSPDGRWIGATTSAHWFPLVARADGKRQYGARFIQAAAVRWPRDCKRMFFYRIPSNAGVGWGWIVHGPRGIPRLARVQARATVGSQVDWRC